VLERLAQLAQVQALLAVLRLLSYMPCYGTLCPCAAVVDACSETINTWHQQGVQGSAFD
jgi:hypothetical protein